MSKINFIVFFVLVCISNCIGEHYQTLDISPTASIEEIKKAYKILALKYHPDKVENTEENKNMFFKISKAYKVLSNEESRKIYDLDGQDAIDQIEENKKPSDEEMDEIYSDFFNRGKQAFNDQDEELFVNTEVIKLGYDNYSKLINRNKIWLILFYNALDEKLDEIVYEWKILASKSYDLFNIAYVSCRFNQVFCDEFEIKKTPEILFYGEAGYGLKEHSKYLGKKLWKDMFTYASNSMLNYVRSIDIYNYKEFLRDNPTKYKVLLFTNKPYIPAQLKALSKKFFPNLFFGCVKNAVKNELINKENYYISL